MNKTQNNIDKVKTPGTAAKPAAPAANGAKPTSKPAAAPATALQNTKKKRRRIHFKPTVGGMLSLLALILIVAAIVTALVFLTKGAIQLVSNAKNTTTSQTTDPNNGQTTLPWNNAYVTTAYPNTNITVGDMILVNSQNAYSLADSIVSKTTNLYKYDGHGSLYVLPGSDTRVHNSAVSPLIQMITALVEADPEGVLKTTTDKLYITGAYRDIALQTTLNTNNPQTYPEVPGYSEHHTGLAFDLKVMSNSAPIQLRDSEYEWLEAHCAEYGFIIRYPASKSSQTGIADEPYHLRYVGVAHATYMTEHDLCLEEYLELLRGTYSYDKSPLEFKAGEQDYLVYYVAADTTEGATFTSIPVPPASEGTYTISGDNMNGFIVTVTKTAK